MAIIYKKQDRLRVRIEDIIVELSPLTFQEKNIIKKHILSGDLDNAAVTAVKMCLKQVTGLKNVDGSDYELSFNGEELTDETIDDLLNLNCREKIVLTSLNLVGGVPSVFIDEESGNPIEGVEILQDQPEKK